MPADRWAAKGERCAAREPVGAQWKLAEFGPCQPGRTFSSNNFPLQCVAWLIPVFEELPGRRVVVFFALSLGRNLITKKNCSIVRGRKTLVELRPDERTQHWRRPRKVCADALRSACAVNMGQQICFFSPVDALSCLAGAKN